MTIVAMLHQLVQVLVRVRVRVLVLALVDL